MSQTRDLTAGDVEHAALNLRGVAAVTPLESSRALTSDVLGQVSLKCENLQRSGSFKIRGAYHRISKLSAAERAQGVVAASAGNHAQGVALASQLMGIEATIFMPSGAALPKVAATQGYGAKVVLSGRSVDDSLAAAIEYAGTHGGVFIHPFDHEDIIAGQGTVGLEIFEQAPDADTIVVGVGGGGLLAGIALVAKARAAAQGREIRVVGVQAKHAAAYPASLAAGRPMQISGGATMADGIAVGTPGAVPFSIVKELVDDVITVEEESISRAMLLLQERAKLVVEPAGAVSVAALIEQPDRVAGAAPSAHTVAVLSGGNIDPLLLLRVLRHGLSAAGRYMNLQVRVPDQPGNLVKLLDILAKSDANVLEIGHVRTGRSLTLDEVEIDLQLETRGATHRTEVLAKLRRAGYMATVIDADQPNR
ncbi:threonine ammonia-lyase [Saxibacter everestensis]|uniref:L-threonine dehydratase catabolic TdcB n=1 Tax=Saxibacter everestensis TaxID=2909229 RepID=A0ABY8QNZ2_9MICO|nr:threonine ammonia-lyase [Brevibacteriaceae bacterium ZFBP1038]